MLILASLAWDVRSVDLVGHDWDLGYVRRGMDLQRTFRFRLQSLNR